MPAPQPTPPVPPIIINQPPINVTVLPQPHDFWITFGPYVGAATAVVVLVVTLWITGLREKARQKIERTDSIRREQREASTEVLIEMELLLRDVEIRLQPGVDGLGREAIHARIDAINERFVKVGVLLSVLASVAQEDPKLLTRVNKCQDSVGEFRGHTTNYGYAWQNNAGDDVLSTRRAEAKKSGQAVLASMISLTDYLEDNLGPMTSKEVERKKPKKQIED